MKFTGNLRKMKSQLGEVVNYTLPLYDILSPNYEVSLNEQIGKKLKITYEKEIHCVITGKKIRKAYGEGMSYDAYLNSPQASPSIINPELSRIHEGIALRDYEWEMKHHMQPHYVYLSNTSTIKVGVTRVTQVPTRWIDQGTSQALIIAETPYRQIAGIIEVVLKKNFNDKTNWQKMLKENPAKHDLNNEKLKAINYLPNELLSYTNINIPETIINYPVLKYPEKIQNIKLDNINEIEGVLTGIKGQYLMLDYLNVFNVRNHTGYKISIEV